MDTIKTIFCKIETLFSIFKKGQGMSAPSPTSCAPASSVLYFLSQNLKEIM